MGYMTFIGPCVRCHLPSTFNPNLVPSIRLTPDGPREPICPDCVAIAKRAPEKDRGAADRPAPWRV